jgi:hypothetical protein
MTLPVLPPEPGFPQKASSLPGVSPLQRRMQRMRSLNVVVEKIPEKQRFSTFTEYMTNCPEYWELSGIAVIAKALRPDSNVHITGISSAHGLNRVRKAMKKAKCRLTTELAP